MKTYNTYQEAKIANPDYAIYGNSIPVFGVKREMEFMDHSFYYCEPCEYCITVKKFLDYGLFFDVGDMWIDYDGEVMTVSSKNVDAVNLPHHMDDKRYVLKSINLKVEIPTEAQEEREVLDIIDTAPKQVESLANNSEFPNGSEWKNGDECIYMTHNVIHQFIGPCPKREGYGYIQAPGFEVNFVELSKLSKPESPEQKAERERLEAIKEMAKTPKPCGFAIYDICEQLYDAGYRKDLK